MNCDAAKDELEENAAKSMARWKKHDTGGGYSDYDAPFMRPRFSFTPISQNQSIELMCVIYVSYLQILDKSPQVRPSQRYG